MTLDARRPKAQCRSRSGSLSQGSVDDILGSECNRFRLGLAIELDPIAVLRLSCESHGLRRSQARNVPSEQRSPPLEVLLSWSAPPTLRRLVAREL